MDRSSHRYARKLVLKCTPTGQGETDCDLESRPSNVLNLMKEWKDELRNESLSMTELRQVDDDDDDGEVNDADDDRKHGEERQEGDSALEANGIDDKGVLPSGKSNNNNNNKK